MKAEPKETSVAKEKQAKATEKAAKPEAKPAEKAAKEKPAKAPAKPKTTSDTNQPKATPPEASTQASGPMLARGDIVFAERFNEAVSVIGDQINEYADRLLAEHTNESRVTTVNADDARPFSEFYEQDPLLFSAASHPLASAVSNRAWDLALERANKKTDRVLFMAGGGGSGKGFIQGQFKLAEQDTIIFDGTLAKLKSAQKKIDQALATGMPVEIVYVNTPAIQALRNAVKRATGKTARAVPIEILAEAHAGASATIRQINQLYGGRVKIRVFNSNPGGTPTEGTIDDVFKYDPAQLERDLSDEFDRIAGSDPRVTPKVYMAFTGREPSERPGDNSPEPVDGGLRVRGQPDQGQPPGAPDAQPNAGREEAQAQAPVPGQPAGVATGVPEGDRGGQQATGAGLAVEAPTAVALDGLMIDIDVRIAETGDVASMRIDAGAAMRDLDAREAAAQKLKECV